MPKGIALHIGIDKYDSRIYRGEGLFLRALPNCKRDAEAMRAIARRSGFDSAVFTDKGASIGNFADALKVASKYLEPGDMFFISFSGHGRELRNMGNDEENDLNDQAWCFHDGTLVDDDIYEMLLFFRPGVRILVIADSCHSGTSIKKVRVVSLGDRFIPEKTGEMQATCLLLSACQDSETTSAGSNLSNSLFTHAMLRALKEDHCASYNDLFKSVSDRMPTGSKPNLFKMGPGTDQFARKKPFRI